MNKFLRILRTAFRALRRNVMRSALTTLGIVIGVAAVIAMTEIGQGSSAAVQKTIASMGANNLLVMPGTASSGGVTFGGGSVITLTPQDADAIARECPAVNSVATVVRTRTQATFANKNWVPSYIYGTTPSFLDVREWTDLEEGEPFTDADVPTAPACAWSVKPSSTSCSTTNRPSAGKSACRTSVSGSLACSAPAAPT
jgi:ABC-type lipoprotein release transport system permease subunit